MKDHQGREIPLTRENAKRMANDPSPAGWGNAQVEKHKAFLRMFEEKDRPIIENAVFDLAFVCLLISENRREFYFAGAIALAIVAFSFGWI